MTTWAMTVRVTPPVNAVQLDNYLSEVATVVENRANGQDGFQLVGVTLNEQVAKDPPVFADVPVELLMIVGVNSNVPDVVQTRIFNTIGSLLPWARTVTFTAPPAYTDAELDVRLLQFVTESGIDTLVWQVNRQTDFTGLATDPVALAARFVPVAQLRLI